MNDLVGSIESGLGVTNKVVKVKSRETYTHLSIRTKSKPSEGLIVQLDYEKLEQLISFLESEKKRLQHNTEQGTIKKFKDDLLYKFKYLGAELVVKGLHLNNGNYLACDRDGSVYLYENRPMISKSSFFWIPRESEEFYKNIGVVGCSGLEWEISFLELSSKNLKFEEVF